MKNVKWRLYFLLLLLSRLIGNKKLALNTLNHYVYEVCYANKIILLSWEQCAGECIYSILVGSAENIYMIRCTDPTQYGFAGMFGGLRIEKATNYEEKLNTHLNEHGTEFITLGGLNSFLSALSK